MAYNDFQGNTSSDFVRFSNGLQISQLNGPPPAMVNQREQVEMNLTLDGLVNANQAQNHEEFFMKENQVVHQVDGQDDAATTPLEHIYDTLKL